ncbi:MAG: hypothetical protein ACOY9J_03530 [Pseudomonadota bacterium]
MALKPMACRALGTAALVVAIPLLLVGIGGLLLLATWMRLTDRYIVIP